VGRLVEISMLMKKALCRSIKTLQSLYHGLVAYQHACTRVGLTKMAYPCKRNREHKQEPKRTQLNLYIND
jgi:hypothetical protein